MNQPPKMNLVHGLRSEVSIVIYARAPHVHRLTADVLQRFIVTPHTRWLHYFIFPTSIIAFQQRPTTILWKTSRVTRSIPSIIHRTQLQTDQTIRTISHKRTFIKHFLVHVYSIPTIEPDTLFVFNSYELPRNINNLVIGHVRCV